MNIKSNVSYEGQAAIILENTANKNINSNYEYVLEDKDGLLEFDWRCMIASIVEDIKNGVSKDIIASKFMNTLICYANDAVNIISRKTGIRDIVLSGGVFQNIYLLTRLKDRLKSCGYNVYTHSRVSTNDEGISLGQLSIVANGGGVLLKKYL